MDNPVPLRRLELAQEELVHAELAHEADEPHFLIGRNRHALWVVTETHGRCGGLFNDEAAALRYAKEESLGRPEAIEFVQQPLDLDLAASGTAGAPRLKKVSLFF